MMHGPTLPAAPAPAQVPPVNLSNLPFGAGAWTAREFRLNGFPVPAGMALPVASPPHVQAARGVLLLLLVQDHSGRVRPCDKVPM